MARPKKEKDYTVEELKEYFQKRAEEERALKEELKTGLYSRAKKDYEADLAGNSAYAITEEDAIEKLGYSSMFKRFYEKGYDNLIELLLKDVMEYVLAYNQMVEQQKRKPIIRLDLLRTVKEKVGNSAVGPLGEIVNQH